MAVDVVTEIEIARAQPRGEPAGFARLAAPMVATAMRANRKDLERLKRLLEQGR
jgi:hypothetical protein